MADPRTSITQGGQQARVLTGMNINEWLFDIQHAVIVRGLAPYLFDQNLQYRRQPVAPDFWLVRYQPSAAMGVLIQQPFLYDTVALAPCAKLAWQLKDGFLLAKLDGNLKTEGLPDSNYPNMAQIANVTRELEGQRLLHSFCEQQVLIHSNSMKVLELIKGSIHPDLLCHVAECTSPLLTLHKLDSILNSVELKRYEVDVVLGQWRELRLTHQSLSDYMRSVSYLCKRMKALGYTLEKQDLVKAIVTNLPDCLHKFRYEEGGFEGLLNLDGLDAIEHAIRQSIFKKTSSLDDAWRPRISTPHPAESSSRMTVGFEGQDDE